MVVDWEGSVSERGLKKGVDVKRWSLRPGGGVERATERQCRW